MTLHTLCVFCYTVRLVHWLDVKGMYAPQNLRAGVCDIWRILGCAKATPFTRVTVKDISSRPAVYQKLPVPSEMIVQYCAQGCPPRLHDMGFQRFGNEKVWNGHTGRPLTNKIFVGPVYPMWIYNQILMY